MASTDAFGRLSKILQLERQHDYRNKSVIGGLDKFASRWEMDARRESSDGAAVSEIVALMLGYPAIEDPAARARIIEKIQKRAADAVAAQQTQEPPSRGEAPVEVESATQTPGGNAAPDEVQSKESPRPAEPSLPTIGKPAHLRPANERAEGLVAQAAAPTPEPAPVASRPVDAPPLRPAPASAVVDSGDAPAPRTPPPSSAVPARRPRAPDFGLDAPITRLPRVGPSMAEKLAKLGVLTVHDLLYLLPHRYEDYSQLRTISQLRHGEEVTIIGTCWKIESRIIGENRRMVNAVIGDGTGELLMTWFNPYVERQLQRGRAYRFSGKIDSYRGQPVMRNPKYEQLEARELHTARIVPIYPQTEGLTTNFLRQIMKDAVDAWGGDMPDFLPESVRREAGLLRLGEALEQIHWPDNKLRLAEAHRRLSFDEFFLLQLGVLGHRQRFRSQTARALQAGADVLAPFLAALPFPLTGAQQRTLGEISSDLAGTQPMSRLVQGDVGSGKTAVAAAALWAAVANGAQGAIMAPTEILAEQHARTFGRLFATLRHPAADRPVRVALLTGSLARGERDALLADLASGELDIAIGTHALIQGDVAFRDLAVVVVDEQHRFGVEQRGALRQKGAQPHVLIMSATPIPRSLALTLYGDLDVSVIDEMPAGRIPVKTKWLTTAQRERAYGFIRRQAQSGYQAFMVFPLVEEGVSGAPSAVEEHVRLSRDVFPDLRVGLLHGRLKGEEKDTVMRAFAAGDLDVLVATSVVEVGIDVPNATVIAIEGAERFGLAQLHQFRGRVGRGDQQSYCILLSDAADGEGVQRLQALETSNDGFALAQIDLEMRGPGDFLGTRQSGLPPLQAASLGDLRTLETARAAAQKLFAADPQLIRPEHRTLAAQVASFWASATEMS